MSGFGAELRAMREARPPAPGQHRRSPHRSLFFLAKQAGLDHGQLSHIEHGRKLPGLGTLARIAAALDLTDEELGRLVRAARDTGMAL